MRYNFPRAQGKYIAFCEGDDYWIDPYKLQKQVDYLRNNDDCGLVLTDVNQLYQDNGKVERNVLKKSKFFSFTSFENLLIHAPFKAPCTWVFRKELLKYPPKNYVVGDLPILLDMAFQSRVYQLEDITAVYRVLTHSASHFTSLEKSYLFMKGIYEIQLEYASNYNVRSEVVNIIQKKFAVKTYFHAVALNDKEQLHFANRLLNNKNDLSLKMKVAGILSKFKFGRYLVKLRLQKS